VCNEEQKGLTLLVPTEVRGYANLSFSVEEASAKYADFFIEEIWVSLWAIFLTASAAEELPEIIEFGKRCH
jgi:hypothetical protein